MKKVILLAALLIFLTGCYHAADNGVTNQVPVPGSNVEEAVVSGELKEFDMVAKQFEFTPSTIEVNQGDTVKINLKSDDVEHGIAIPEFGVSKTVSPGKTITVEFVADKKGTFEFHCSVMCGSGHKEMTGEIIVK